MTILLVGGTGNAGSSILGGLAGREVLSVSRSQPAATPAPGIRWKPVDLENPATLRRALAGEQIDTLIFAAGGKLHLAPYEPIHVAAVRRLTHRLRRRNDFTAADYRRAAALTQSLDEEGENIGRFRTAVEAVRASGAGLRHIIMLTGGMYYGVHTGPIFDKSWSGELSEESPRSVGPNWYFEIEDYAARLAQELCPVTVLRPSFILTEGHGQNLAYCICMYLEHQKRMGLKGTFPGGAGNYLCEFSLTPSILFGEFVAWVLDNPQLWGETFNVTCDKAVTWRELWTQLCEWYGLEVDVPAMPQSLGRRIRELALEDGILQEQGFSPVYFTPFDFIDMTMVCDWPAKYSMRKAAGLGFRSDADVMATFRACMDYLRAGRGRA